jgi:hypothetical protein
MLLATTVQPSKHVLRIRTAADAVDGACFGQALLDERLRARSRSP